MVVFPRDIEKKLNTRFSKIGNQKKLIFDEICLPLKYKLNPPKGAKVLSKLPILEQHINEWNQLKGHVNVKFQTLKMQHLGFQHIATELKLESIKCIYYFLDKKVKATLIEKDKKTKLITKALKLPKKSLINTFNLYLNLDIHELQTVLSILAQLKEGFGKNMHCRFGGTGARVR